MGRFQVCLMQTSRRNHQSGSGSVNSQETTQPCALDRKLAKIRTILWKEFACLNF